MKLKSFLTTLSLLSLSACFGGGQEATLNTGGGNGGYILHAYVDGWPYQGFSSSRDYILALDVSATGTTGGSDSTTIYNSTSTQGLPQADFDSSSGTLDYVIRGLSAGDVYSININNTLTNYPSRLSCSNSSSPGTLPITGTANSGCDNQVCNTHIRCTYVLVGSVTGLGTGKTVGLSVVANSVLPLGLVDSTSETDLDLMAVGNGSFHFNTGLTKYDQFSLTVSTQPEGQHCTVAHGSGEVPTNLDAITVTCRTNYIFENMNGFTGAEVSISAADTLCQNDTELPDGYTAKALIVDGSTRYACTTANCTTGGVSENHDWVLYPSTTYYRLDGTKIVDTNSSGLFESSLTNAISVSGQPVWTGLNADWTSDTSHNCSNWSSASGSFSGTVGDSGATDGSVIHGNDPFSTYICSNSLPILCVTQ